MGHEVSIGAIQFQVTNSSRSTLLSFETTQSDSSITSLQFLSNFRDPTCFGLQITRNLLQLHAKGVRQGGMCGHTFGIKAILLEVIIESNVPSTRNSQPREETQLLSEIRYFLKDILANLRESQKSKLEQIHAVWPNGTQEFVEACIATWSQRGESLSEFFLLR